MGPWIGGYQPNNSAWNWIDGETWGFTAWESNQPSNQTDQDYVHYYVYLGSTGDPTSQPPTWNDYADIQGTVYGYVVEYSPTPVPEPASILLLGSGIAGLAGMRKKRMMKKKNRG